MKYICIFFFFALLASCNKSDAIIETQPPAPADSAQVIYVNAAASGANTSSLYSFDENGRIVWELGNIRPVSFWSTPAYSNKRLFMAIGHQMVCLNAETAATVWTYNGVSNVVHPKLKGDTLLTAVSLIAPSPINTLLLLNKNTGSVLWSKSVSDQPLVPPVISDGKIYSLTTNGTGTISTVTAYDLQTKNLVWQKNVAAGFLMSLPPDMILRGDTLITGSFTNQITLLNKSTGALYWSKAFYADQSFIYNNEIVYNDNDNGRVTKISLQTGTVTMQSAPVYYARGGGMAYIYDDHFYYRRSDSLFCTSLLDGSIQRSKASGDYLTKLTLIGKTVYASKLDYALNNESRIMVLNAKDLSVRDSVKVPLQYINNFSILSTANKFY